MANEDALTALHNRRWLMQTMPRMLARAQAAGGMLATGHPVAEQLAAIKALGVRLLVDDSGASYSSLSQLQQLDPDVLKVDRVFTSQLSAGAQGVAFFRAIVSMAHVLDMNVVAEGVETEEELRLLRELACDEVQGYYISRPLPPDATEALIRGAATQACILRRTAPDV